MSWTSWAMLTICALRSRIICSSHSRQKRMSDSSCPITRPPRRPSYSAFSASLALGGGASGGERMKCETASISASEPTNISRNESSASRVGSRKQLRHSSCDVCSRSTQKSASFLTSCGACATW